MSLPAYPHNAHVLDLLESADLARELAAVGEPAEAAEAAWEQTACLVVRLERVQRELRKALEALAPEPQAPVRVYGGGAALLLAGSRRSLQRLASGLRTRGQAETGEEIARCLQTERPVWRWGRRTLDFRGGALVMGIVNCTPDSFYPASRLPDSAAALEAARAMIAAGAHILDVGGESTRPGSDLVPADEERRRVLPVIEAVRRESDVLLSIDTRKPEVAAAALDAGADLINDISALRDDRRCAAASPAAPAESPAPGVRSAPAESPAPPGSPAQGLGPGGMAGLAARRGAPLVLMHTLGEPKTMQVEPHYTDVVSEVLAELAAAVQFASAAGVQRLIVDPGIGFGKRLADNLCLLRNLGALRSLGCPVMVGLSRKSFLGAVTGAPVEERLAATIAGNALAVLGGADIVRVHDVPEAVQTVRLIQAVREAGCR